MRGDDEIGGDWGTPVMALKMMILSKVQYFASEVFVVLKQGTGDFVQVV
jgi:hypothetical protein